LAVAHQADVVARVVLVKFFRFAGYTLHYIIQMDLSLLSDPQHKVELTFKSLKTFQRALRSLEGFIPKKLPSLRTQKKELRRKENLKSLYLRYLGLLGLTPCLEELEGVPFQQSEVQLRALIQHQVSFLSESKASTPRVSLGVSGTIYRNPLVLGIKTVFCPETKLFRPEMNGFSVKSHFFHEETLGLLHRQQLDLSIEQQIQQLTSGKINSLINKQRKIDENYRKAYEKLCARLKQQKLLPAYTRQVSLITNPNLKSLKILASPSPVSLKSCRSQTFSEDSASTSRSSSANQRLGFFISPVNY